MTKSTRTAISIFWLLLTYIPFIIVCFNLKYPTFDKLRYGYIIMPVLLILPIVSLLYSLLSDRLFNGKKAIDVIMTVLAVLCFLYTLVFTFGFRIVTTILYPMASYTENADNYLRIEDDFAETDQRYIDEFLPASIPESAENVKYRYYGSLHGDNLIEAAWELPENEYLPLKTKVLASKSYTQDDEGYSYNIFDGEKYEASIDFNDAKHKVCYSFICNTPF